MALTQYTLTVTPPVVGAFVARASWASGLTTPKLIGAIAVLPTPNRPENPFTVRARLDGATVTVEVSAPTWLTPVDVLLTLDA